MYGNCVKLRLRIWGHNYVKYHARDFIAHIFATLKYILYFMGLTIKFFDLNCRFYREFRKIHFVSLETKDDLSFTSLLHF